MKNFYHQALILLLLGFAQYISAQCIDPKLFVSDLDGSNGFAVNGNTPASQTGENVRAIGDINGDGFDDVIISAHWASPNGNHRYGEVYAVFGTATGIDPSLGVSNLNGSNGFILEGNSFWSGRAISYAGDFNNDGIDDFMVSSIYNNPTGDYNDSNTGSVYLIYGKTSGFPANLNLNDIDGSNGFVMHGINGGDITGTAVNYAGDINGDNIDDIIIGAQYAVFDGLDGAGRVYVVFGSADGFPPEFQLADLNGENGFHIFGDTDGYNFGSTVGSAGDLNNDGIDDVLIGEFRGIRFPGASYASGNGFVFYGAGGSFESSYYISDFDGTKGFMTSEGHKISGIGDFNNDGVDDIAMGSQGDLFVLFGREDPYAAVFDLSTLNGANGFKIDQNFHGFTTIAGGDFNNDNISDLIIGFGNGSHYPGVFIHLGGEEAYEPILDLNTNTSITITNSHEQGYFGRSIDANFDFNGDGKNDLIVGASSSTERDEINGKTGAAYVFFGFDFEIDTEKPVITCPNDQILVSGESLPDYTTLITVTDDCDDTPEITQSPMAGTTFTTDLTVTIFATDASGKTEICTFEVTDTPDTEAPEITCPGNQTIACTATEVPDFTDLLTVTDDRDSDPNVIQSPTAGTTFTDGMTITMTAEDATGNTSACTFTVTWEEDTEAPSITCPSEQSLIPGEDLPDYINLATVTDDCDANPVITQSPAAGTEFTSEITITLTAKDANGNIETCNFEVTEIPDTKDPEITCPGNQILACDATEVPDFTDLVIAADDRDSNPQVTQSPAAGTAFTDGIIITMTAEDEAGNINFCTFTVRFETDTEAPIITCPTNQSLISGEGLPDYSNLTTVIDNCDNDIVITQSPVVGTEFNTDIIVILTATDASGNTQTCAFGVTDNPDIEAPEISCLPNQEVVCTVTKVPDFLADIIVSDNRDENPVLIQNPEPGTEFTGETNILITATDAAGNRSECSFNLQIREVEAPFIICLPDQELAVNEKCEVVVPDFRELVEAESACAAITSITQSPTVGTVIFENTLASITVEDSNGQQSTCNFNLSIPENIFPEVDAGANVKISVGDNHQLDAFASTEGVFSWSPAKGLSDAEIPNPVASPEKSTTYIVTFTSVSGCVTEDEIVIEVEKIIVPKGFSPDYDGINDTWVIGGIENYPDNKVIVHNRWGNIVFSIKSYNNTSRSFNGNANRNTKMGAGELPEGTYYYNIQLNAEEQPIQGFIVLKK